jgi:ethanolamine utilization protein EutQ (cupin superfamily)
MTVYIIEGSVDLVTPETTMTLSAGSLVRIPADQEYQWKPNPTVKMLVISHPAWKADQHRVIA